MKVSFTQVGTACMVIDINGFVIVMNAEKFIPTHFEGWKHFNEQPEYLYDQVIHSDIRDKLVWLQPGIATEVEI